MLEIEVAKKWVEALRSGKYNKGIGTLFQKIRDKEYYCALGVLYKVAYPSLSLGDMCIDTNYDKLRDLGLTQDELETCYLKNDNGGMFRDNFPEIADWVEKTFIKEAL